MENKDEPNQDLLPVEIEENQSYLLTYEKNNSKEDIIVLVLSFFLILAHLLNSFFNKSINLDHKQTIGILQQPNINNITASYQITNIMPTNLFLTIGFLFSKSNINTKSHALVNLTALINSSFNSQTVFEKGIHKLNLHFSSRKNKITSNFYPFFCSNRVNFDSFRLIFAAKGFFNDFTHCMIEIVYSNPIFTYFCFFTFSISIIIIIILIIVYFYKTHKIKGKHSYRSEFGYVICLLLFSLFYMIVNLFIFTEKSILSNIQFILSSIFISCFFTTIIFFRNLNYPFNTKKDFIISSLFFVIYFLIDFFSLFLEIPILSIASYILRILLSIISLITTVKYEKASLKEYGNNLLFYSGFILLFGFTLNYEKLILLSQQFYNKMLNRILTSQTIFAYSLAVTYILFPVSIENDHSKNRQPSKQLSNYIEENNQNDK